MRRWISLRIQGYVGPLPEGIASLETAREASPIRHPGDAPHTPYTLQRVGMHIV